MEIQNISLDKILHTPQNPRSDPGEDLDGLAASMGDPAAPTLAQYPVVAPRSDGMFVVVAGDRRTHAARQAGWKTIPCVVVEGLDPLQLHELRLAENLHRKPLHPLDEAAAIKISWLAANAEALDLGEAAHGILAQEVPPIQALQALETLLAEAGFVANHPAVTWDELLARLGLDLDRERRKRLLGVLTVDTAVQVQARSLPMTEAALRAISRLEPAAQERLVAEIAAEPALAKKARRIARVVRDGSYTLDEALAEARGEVFTHEHEGEEEHEHEDTAPGVGEINLLDDSMQIMEAVIDLQTLVNQISETVQRVTDQLTTLRSLGGGSLAALQPPWGEYAQDAVDVLAEQCTALSKALEARDDQN
jgi:ParB-like chromosome segregation protein Spo0J